MKLEDIHESRLIRNTVITLGILIVVLSLLFIGMNIGERRARFAGAFGENFERNFIGPREGMGRMMLGWSGRDGIIPGGHGAVGKIVSINLPQIIISGPDNLEKTILIENSTIVRSFRTNIKITDLKVGDFVAVLGNPNNSGQIVANLVRLMPVQINQTTTTPR